VRRVATGSPCPPLRHQSRQNTLQADEIGAQRATRVRIFRTLWRDISTTKTLADPGPPGIHRSLSIRQHTAKEGALAQPNRSKSAGEHTRRKGRKTRCFCEQNPGFRPTEHFLDFWGLGRTFVMTSQMIWQVYSVVWALVKELGAHLYPLSST
jgi:hypothetical protein